MYLIFFIDDPKNNNTTGMKTFALHFMWEHEFLWSAQSPQMSNTDEEHNVGEVYKVYKVCTITKLFGSCCRHLMLEIFS